jgi:hypothetical protein
LVARCNTGILLPEGLSRFAFRRLSEKQKKNQKLCVLCASAVNFYKDPFRVSIMPPFLGVVIDFAMDYIINKRAIFAKRAITILCG